jgi:SAM-dependent methyltransferase
MSLTALLEDPRLYRFSQKLNPMTVGLYRQLLQQHVASEPITSVLDIGCGVGAHRSLFPGTRYAGIDVNPAYVEMATRHYGEGFRVMGAGALDFDTGTFDAAFTTATCHHLDDETVASMVAEALRVVAPGGAFHIVEPVVPTSPRGAIKRVLFANDRGRHQRTLHALTSLVQKHGRIQSVDLRAGVLHDVCYVRLAAL